MREEVKTGAARSSGALKTSLLKSRAKIVREGGRPI